MRIMPTFTTDERGNTAPIPSTDAPNFLVRMESIAGRNLTVEEQTKVDQMSAHNWTLRVQAAELFGADAVDAHFAPKENK